MNNNTDSDYGAEEVFVKGEYASEYGLIFPFVMYPTELVHFAVSRDGEGARRFFELFDTEYVKTRDNVAALEREMGRTFNNTERAYLLLDRLWLDNLKTHEFMEKHHDLIESFRKLIGQYMFTVADYRELVATKFAEHLIFLRKQNRNLYLKEVALLTAFLTSSLARPAVDRLIKNVMSEAGFPFEFEMRLPVAIPAEALNIGQTSICSSWLRRWQNQKSNQ